jgi:RNA polymerase sigma factor (sigma-70 family)
VAALGRLIHFAPRRSPFDLGRSIVSGDQTFFWKRGAMAAQAYEPTPEDLVLLDAVIRSVARARRLAGPDLQDFAQIVHLKLLERRYDVFSRFRGDSSLRTYLTVVITRILLDWRNARYGKWRSSAAAARLGPIAVGLERLIWRDGHTMGEAVEIMRQATGLGREQLDDIAERLPRRITRREVPSDLEPAALSEPFRDPIAAREGLERAHQVRRALRRAYLTLPPDDRRLLALRYQRSMTVRQIGRDLDIDPKALYRRFERLTSKLRRDLGTGTGCDLSASF